MHCLSALAVSFLRRAACSSWCSTGASQTSLRYTFFKKYVCSNQSFVGVSRLSLGCAGFAALDKFRPFFLTGTFGTLALRSHMEHRLGVRAPRPLSWAAALVLAFLPQLLALRNQSRPGAPLISAPPQSAGLVPPIIPAESLRVINIEAKVRGVKCEGCATGFREALRTNPSSSAASSADASVDWRSCEETVVNLTVAGACEEGDLVGAALASLQEACSTRDYTYSLSNYEAAQ